MKRFLAIGIFLCLVPFAGADQPSNVKPLKQSIRLIVIDPGFGGKESGPSGCSGKVFAKDINLSISKKTIEKISRDLKIDAILTRDQDQFLPLEERSAIANTKGADVFISIHVNGANDTSVNGIETYYLNLLVHPEAAKNAANEHSVGTKAAAGMELILSDLMVNRKIEESQRLANDVQSELVGHMALKYGQIKSRGVKQAPFYVLLVPQMPAIMVQVGFLKNSVECERLLTEGYQDDIATGIVDGIRKFIEEKRE